MAIRQRGGSGPAAPWRRGAGSGGRKVSGPRRTALSGGTCAEGSMLKNSQALRGADALSCLAALPARRVARPAQPPTQRGCDAAPGAAGRDGRGSTGGARHGAPHRRRPSADRIRQGLNARAPDGHALPGARCPISARRGVAGPALGGVRGAG